MRIFLLLVAIAVAAAGCTSAERQAAVSAPSQSVAPAGDRCATDTLHGDPPSWSAPANPPGGTRTALAEDGNALAVIFADPLRAGERHDGVNNKILWVVQAPRDGKPLHITATMPGAPTVEHSEPADSGP